MASQRVHTKRSTLDRNGPGSKWERSCRLHNICPRTTFCAHRLRGTVFCCRPPNTCGCHPAAMRFTAIATVARNCTSWSAGISLVPPRVSVYLDFRANAGTLTGNKRFILRQHNREGARQALPHHMAAEAILCTLNSLLSRSISCLLRHSSTAAKRL